MKTVPEQSSKNLKDIEKILDMEQIHEQIQVLELKRKIHPDLITLFKSSRADPLVFELPQDISYKVAHQVMKFYSLIENLEITYRCDEQADGRQYLAFKWKLN
jgi:hypothetical protein